MAEVFLPVGHDVGPVYEQQGAEQPYAYEVRFADGSFQLSRDEYIVWRTAAGDLEQVITSGAPTRESITAQAKERDVADPEAVTKELISAGALAVLDGASETAAQLFAYHHRAMPLQRGLGNSPEDPQLFEIAADSPQNAVVGPFAYYIWMHGHRYPNLWAACEALFTPDEDGEKPEGTPSDALAEFFIFLPQLLAGNCVYFDRSA